MRDFGVLSPGSLLPCSPGLLLFSMLLRLVTSLLPIHQPSLYASYYVFGAPMRSPTAAQVLLQCLRRLLTNRGGETVFVNINALVVQGFGEKLAA